MSVTDEKGDMFETEYDANDLVSANSDMQVIEHNQSFQNEELGDGDNILGRPNFAKSIGAPDPALATLGNMSCDMGREEQE